MMQLLKKQKTIGLIFVLSYVLLFLFFYNYPILSPLHGIVGLLLILLTFVGGLLKAGEYVEVMMIFISTFLMFMFVVHPGILESVGHWSSVVVYLADGIPIIFAIPLLAHLIGRSVAERRYMIAIWMVLVSIAIINEIGIAACFSRYLK